jgi:hypothetical protein
LNEHEQIVGELVNDAVIVALQRVKDGEDIKDVMKEYTNEQ